MKENELIEKLDKYTSEILKILEISDEVESKNTLEPLPDWAKTRLSQLWGNMKWLRAEIFKN